MEIKHYWADFFENWPKKMPHRGVVVTSFGDQILFAGFLIGADLLIIERHAPDTVGARQVILPYENIQAVKIVEVAQKNLWSDLGFSGKLPEK